MPLDSGLFPTRTTDAASKSRAAEYPEYPRPGLLSLCRAGGSSLGRQIKLGGAHRVSGTPEPTYILANKHRNVRTLVGELTFDFNIRRPEQAAESAALQESNQEHEQER